MSTDSDRLPRWEYKVELIDFGNLELQLNLRGEANWEVVVIDWTYVTGGCNVVFKRRGRTIS